jgi:hypothetical protein
MSKKNKDIEVRMEDVMKTVAGKQVEVTELLIGKKVIGEILEEGPKTFTMFMDNENKGQARTFETAVESIIRDWHLQE